MTTTSPQAEGRLAEPQEHPQRLACTLCDGNGHRCDYCDGDGFVLAEDMPQHTYEPNIEWSLSS